jgi:hypothetical protein
MTSTIKVNNIQNQCGQNIINENSNTITIGASGDTIALASGASQSGFGREGSVDWQTSIKTSDFTAVSGEGYFINTTSGEITMTLPSSPSAGDIVAIKDYANTFDTNKLTVNRNGSNIGGDALNPEVTTEGQALTLVFGDSTKGWQAVAAATESDLPKPTFITATGGTITTVCTNFKVHTFTGPGTFTVTCAGNTAGSNTIDYLVVAGGGAGANKTSPSNTGEAGGGGGAGGYRESPGSASGCYSVSPRGAAPAVALPVTATGYPITVGAGGTSSGACGNASSTRSGSNSVLAGSSTITSAGGGGGGARAFSTPVSLSEGAPGGSGGGGAYYGPTSSGQPGGTGNAPPTNPAQGTNGGSRVGGCGAGGGGGGATGAGVNAGGPGNPLNDGAGGTGGVGATSSINGTPTARAGGGGGAGNADGYPTGASGAASPCGTGGVGGNRDGVVGANGTTNTGGGGGGGSGGGGAPGDGATGQGGSGIVIIRYRFQ